MYTSFARVYDRLMGDVDYPRWAAFYQELLEEWGVKRGSQVAECACGTGNLTIPLSHFYGMTGVDLSEDMLQIAIPKARAQGRNIRFVRQDMRKLTLHKPVDALLCTCDGFNYLMTSAQAHSFLSSAWTALKPGGVLALDLSTPYKLQQVLGNNTITRVEDDLVCLWQNEWEAPRQRVHMQLDIFVQAGDSYQRIVETQSQQAHTQEELTQYLARAGFEEITRYGDLERDIHSKDQRMHLFARKP